MRIAAVAVAVAAALSLGGCAAADCESYCNTLEDCYHLNPEHWDSCVRDCETTLEHGDLDEECLDCMSTQECSDLKGGICDPHC